MTWLTARNAAIVVAIVLLATLPKWVGNPYYINVSSQILLFAVFALALNVLVGYGGLVSLGHAALFAISGYTAALMLQAGYGDRGHANGVGCFRRARIALDRHRLPDDYARARANPLGHRLPLGEPDKRRQRRKRANPPCPVRLRPR
jgi:ABC-type branched-subunit amino acid transport system permease subunit